MLRPGPSGRRSRTEGGLGAPSAHDGAPCARRSLFAPFRASPGTRAPSSSATGGPRGCGGVGGTAGCPAARCPRGRRFGHSAGMRARPRPPGPSGRAGPPRTGAGSAPSRPRDAALRPRSRAPPRCPRPGAGLRAVWGRREGRRCAPRGLGRRVAEAPLTGADGRRRRPDLPSAGRARLASPSPGPRPRRDQGLAEPGPRFPESRAGLRVGARGGHGRGEAGSGHPPASPSGSSDGV